jgi:alpha-beta hydrolase superfamily lysophospholipase
LEHPKATVPPHEVAVREGTIRSHDGLDLHVRSWEAREPRAVAVVAHGVGEHGGRYAHVAQALANTAQVSMVAPDQRGHGLSPGRRGAVGHYEELVADLTAVLEHLARERPDLPRIVLGHSNGGQVALRAALDPAGGQAIDALILSNPTVRLAVRVPSWKLSLGRFLLHHAPRVTLPVGLRPEQLTRDPVMQQRHRDDPLIHDRISAPLYFGMVDGGHLLEARAAAVRAPLLMILGGSDPVVDPDASRTVFERLGSSDKTLLLFPGMRHEPFNELGREKVLEDVVAWLDHRFGSGSHEKPRKRARCE